MSMPFAGQPFTFTQPDGSELPVRGWGNQHYAVFETLDGFTVAENRVTGFYEYAAVSPDGESLRPVGGQPGVADAARLGLARGLRVTPAAARARGRESRTLPRGGSRWERRRQEARLARTVAAVGGIAAAPPARQTVGDYVGLCLLVQFPDVKGTIGRTEVEAFCNEPGYTGFGNNGSVFDYFKGESAGKLRYTNVVADYYTARHPRAYYANEDIPQPTRTRELIKEALGALEARGFDFNRLTVDSQGFVYAVNVFYAGPVVNNWTKGLWPHAFHLLTPHDLGAGRQAFDYQITNMDRELTLATFCHENGHLVCDFPDLYDYGPESRGVGNFCLMCRGGLPDPKNPVGISAYLKYRAGWAERVTRLAGTVTGALPAGHNEFFLHARSATEYFILENRDRTGRDVMLPDTGLAIWHVDEAGDNSEEAMTAAQHYECSLVQADGRHDLEHGGNDGDDRDLFSADGTRDFGDTTTPHSKWWDGTSSGLTIRNVGPAGDKIEFTATVNA
jgi:M6 family metalloprotease-like protein